MLAAPPPAEALIPALTRIFGRGRQPGAAAAAAPPPPPPGAVAAEAPPTPAAAAAPDAPWPPPLRYFGNPRPTRRHRAAGGAGQRRHRATGCWHHGRRWCLLFSHSSSGVSSPSCRRASTSRPSNTTRSYTSKRLPAQARSPSGILTAPAVRWSAPSSNEPRKEVAGLVDSQHSTQRNALGSSISAEVAEAGKRERRGGRRECKSANCRGDAAVSVPVLALGALLCYMFSWLLAHSLRRWVEPAHCEVEVGMRGGGGS